LKDAAVQKTISGQAPNIYDGRPAIPACVWCMSEKHSKKYFEDVVKDGKTITKLTNEWNRSKTKVAAWG
jgi:hypothetical protein